MSHTDELYSLRHGHLRRLCAELGIAVRRRGDAWVFEGPGVHLLVADLALVRDYDLKPARHSGRWDEV